MNARLEEQFFDSNIPVDDSDQHYRDCLHVIMQSPLMNNKEIPSKQHRKATSIAKTDPRNDYARIIEDAINCADPESFSNTFRYLLDPQCRMERVRLQRKGTNNPQYSADQYMTMYANDATEIVESSVTGVDNIVEQFVGCMQTIPDGIFLVHEWKMFLRSNNACCLVMKFSYTGSKIFNSTKPCFFKDEYEFYDAEELKSCLDFDSGNTNGQFIPTELEFLGSTNTSMVIPTGPMIPNPDVFKSFPTSSNEGMNTFFEANEVSEEPIIIADDDEAQASSAPHTVVFRETTKASKYDHRKRHKKFTIGEFVGTHYFTEEQIAEVTLENHTSSSCGSSLTTQSSSSSLSSSCHHGIGKTCLTRSCSEYSDATSTCSTSLSSTSVAPQEPPILINNAFDQLLEELSHDDEEEEHNASSGMTDESSVQTIYEMNGHGKRSIKAEACTMNAQGIMRWTINNANQITHITCTRLQV